MSKTDGKKTDPKKVELSELTDDAAPTEDLADPAADLSSDPRDLRIEILEAEAADLNDKLMRAAADVQNARKRAERDRRDAEAYGGAKLARDLLAVYDNLDAALKLATDELREKEPGFFNGVELTRKELLNAFAKHKISPLEPEIGDRFDPNHHQAMFEAPSEDAEPGSIIQVMQSGFMISERLLRPAMVGVARKADTAADPDAADTEDASASAN